MRPIDVLRGLVLAGVLVWPLACSQQEPPVEREPQQPVEAEQPAQQPAEQVPQPPAALQAEEAAKPEAPQEASAPATDIAWKTSYEEALKEAAEKDKPVLIDFTAEWCGWCKVLDQLTWPDPDVEKAAGRFVAVKIDGDKHKDLVKKYQVGGFPAMVLTDDEGKSLHTISGFVFPDIMAFQLNAVADGKELNAAFEAYGEGEPQSFHERVLAAELAGRKGNAKRVIELLEDAVKTPPEGKRASYEYGVRTLAMAYASDGQVDKAKQLLTETLQDEATVGGMFLERALGAVDRMAQP